MDGVLFDDGLPFAEDGDDASVGAEGGGSGAVDVVSVGVDGGVGVAGFEPVDGHRCSSWFGKCDRGIVCAVCWGRCASPTPWSRSDPSSTRYSVVRENHGPPVRGAVIDSQQGQAIPGDPALLQLPGAWRRTPNSGCRVARPKATGQTSKARKANLPDLTR